MRRKLLLATLSLSTCYLGIQAQTVESAVYPASHSVYAVSYYGDSVEVSYSTPIAYSGDVDATVVAGTTTLTVVGQAEAATNVIAFPIAAALAGAGVADNTEIALSVPAVKLGEFNYVTVGSTVEAVLIDGTVVDGVETTATYLYRQNLPTCTVDPASGSVESPAFDVTFTFSEAVVCPTVTFLSGTRATGTVYNEVERDLTATTSVTVSVLETYWNTNDEPATMTVQATSLTLNGYSIPNETVEYTYGDSSTGFSYLGVSPDPSVVAYPNIYNIVFKFSGEVTAVDNTIAYALFLDGDDWVDEIAIDTLDAIIEFDEGYGCYIIDILAPAEPSSDYTSVIIDLWAVAHDGTILSEQPSVTYYKSLSSRNIRCITMDETACVSSVSTPKRECVDVYSTTGVLIRKNLPRSEMQTLATGIYIIDGEKLVIR